MNTYKSRISDFLELYGVKVVGFARVPKDIHVVEIEDVLPNAIVFGYRLSTTVLKTVKDRPTLIYKHHYKTNNWILDQTACHLVHFLEDLGSQALAIPASQTIDQEQRTGHVSHKLLGREAGLGYIGRSGLLIHPVHGAQVRYVSVLTDLDFPPDKKYDGGCGSCKKCISVCPAQAISEKDVDIGRCMTKLREFSRIRGIGQFICGVCVRVCNGTH